MLDEYINVQFYATTSIYTKTSTRYFIAGIASKYKMIILFSQCSKITRELQWFAVTIDMQHVHISSPINFTDSSPTYSAESSRLLMAMSLYDNIFLPFNCNRLVQIRPSFGCVQIELRLDFASIQLNVKWIHQEKSNYDQIYLDNTIEWIYPFGKLKRETELKKF